MKNSPDFLTDWCIVGTRANADGGRRVPHASQAKGIGEAERCRLMGCVREVGCGCSGRGWASVDRHGSR